MKSMTIVKLSIIIPAFNEQNRLPPTLHRLFRYLPGLGCSYEIIVADDGSIDQTAELVRQLQNQNDNLVLVSDGINRGRGEAVRIGVSKAQGDLILVTDADGSVADEAIGRFVAAFDSDAELQAVFGSREMRGAVILGAQPYMRWLLGYVFIYLSRLLFSLWHVTDFTLGFKMFRLAAARDIFAHQYDPFFLAEAELVYVAHIRRHRNIELPVAWTDSSDSKVDPLRDVGRSLIGLLQILYRRFTGMYGLA
jgi:dolichyl-phosphate beta-glucosyltransferase